MTRKCELHSIRLDSDVWAAVKALPESLNQYLKAKLLEGDSAPVSVVDRLIKENPAVARKLGNDLLRPHTLHSGTRPIAGCGECAGLAQKGDRAR